MRHFTQVVNSLIINLIAIKLDSVFKSYNHLRYVHYKQISSLYCCVGSNIKVYSNISREQDVTLKMYNLNGNHPVLQNNFKNTPKHIKVIMQTNDKVVLHGYCHDTMVALLADFSFTIKLKKGELENHIFNMHDKRLEIEYLP